MSVVAAVAVGVDLDELDTFFRILLIYHFTGFPYLLTTFLEGYQAEFTSNFVSYLAYLASTLSDFSGKNNFRKGSPTRVLAKNLFSYFA